MPYARAGVKLWSWLSFGYICMHLKAKESKDKQEGEPEKAVDEPEAKKQKLDDDEKKEEEKCQLLVS